MAAIMKKLKLKKSRFNHVNKLVREGKIKRDKKSKGYYVK